MFTSLLKHLHVPLYILIIYSVVLVCNQSDLYYILLYIHHSLTTDNIGLVCLRRDVIKYHFCSQYYC